MSNSKTYRKMKIKRFRLLWLICLGVAAMLLLNTCEHETEEDSEIVYKLSVKQTGSFSTTLVFTHNGTNRDKYYGFAVPSHHVNVSEQIANVVDTLSPKQLLGKAFEQRKREIRLSRLSSRTPYTYIVFGLDENGKYNGRSTSIEFNTVPCDLIINKNPAWTLTYKGETLHNGGYYSWINNDVSGVLTQRYIFVTYSKQQRESFTSEEEFIAYAVETYNQTLNEAHDPDFWLDGSEVFNVSMNFYRYLDPGDYVSYVIGIDVSGQPTGEFNKTPYYSVDEYPMLPGYENMVGKWQLVDKNGKTFQIRLKKKKVNQTLTMTGWSNLNPDITVNYNQNTQQLYFKKQLLASDLHLNYTDGTSADGDLYLSAWYNYNGLTISDLEGILSVGNKITDSKYQFIANFKVYILGGEVNCPMGLTFVFEQDDGTPVLLTNTQLQFPITMKRS